jgi:ParE toxin of type II toxin-antitoxin system, parDE
VSNIRAIIIQPEVLVEAEKIYEYIRINSLQNARNFKKQLLEQIDSVEIYPLANPPENSLNPEKIIVYRFVLIMKSWKLIYKVTDKLIVFSGIIHTSRHQNETDKLKINRE